MARKIVFETEVNQAGFSRGMDMMEARANAANGRMNRTVYEANKRQQQQTESQAAARVEYNQRLERKAATRADLETTRRTQWRQQTAAQRGGPQGFTTGGVAQSEQHAKKMNLAVAGSMFTSVARDSAASLASGAPITQVIAQQAPQVIQALAIMNAGMVAWVAVVSGAAVYAWHGLTKAIGEAVFENAKFLGQANYYAKRADDIRKVRYELDDLTKAENEAAKRALERENRRKDVAKKATEADREWALVKLEGDSKLRKELEFLQEDLAKHEAGGPEKTGTMLDLTNELSAAQRTPEGETYFQKQMRDLLIEEIEADIAAAAANAGTEFETKKLELQNKITAKRGELSKPEKNEPWKRSAHIPGDALVASGNFIGSARGKIEGLAQRQLEVLKLIERNTRLRSSSGASGFPTL